MTTLWCAIYDYFTFDICIYIAVTFSVAFMQLQNK